MKFAAPIVAVGCASEGADSFCRVPDTKRQVERSSNFDVRNQRRSLARLCQVSKTPTKGNGREPIPV
jgi:hypothetical protein